MKKSKQQQVLSIISRCLEEYETNLLNKKVMFIFEDKYKNLNKEEVFFPKSSFYHLTGTVIKDYDGNEINSYDMYNKVRDNKLSLNQYSIEAKNRGTDLKMQVLPQLMRIDRMANMLGSFSGYGFVLQTEKVAGNTNACMGFVNDVKTNTYIPNTALQEDIRNITNNRCKIIAILKKDVTENLYRNITYLKSNSQIDDILRDKDIAKIIDERKIYSADKSVDKKILEFLYNNKQKISVNISNNDKTVIEDYEPTTDEEKILYEIFNYFEMNDIKLTTKPNGIIVAKDGYNNVWCNKEIYEYLINDCFEEGVEVLGDNLLKDFYKYANYRGVSKPIPNIENNIEDSICDGLDI